MLNCLSALENACEQYWLPRAGCTMSPLSGRFVETAPNKALITHPLVIFLLIA